MLRSGHLCAEVLQGATLPQGSDLLPEHLRPEVLRSEVLRSGPLLRSEGLRSGRLRSGLCPGLRSGDLCAEDLLPAPLQARSDLPSEHVRSEVLHAGLRSSLCSGHLCAEVLQRALPSRAVLPRALLPRATLPQGAQVLLRKHLRSKLLRSSRPLLWPRRGSAPGKPHATGSGPNC